MAYTKIEKKYNYFHNSVVNIIKTLQNHSVKITSISGKERKNTRYLGKGLFTHRDSDGK